MDKYLNQDIVIPKSLKPVTQLQRGKATRYMTPLGKHQEEANNPGKADSSFQDKTDIQFYRHTKKSARPPSDFKKLSYDLDRFSNKPRAAGIGQPANTGLLSSQNAVTMNDFVKESKEGDKPPGLEKYVYPQPKLVKRPDKFLNNFR